MKTTEKIFWKHYREIGKQCLLMNALAAVSAYFILYFLLCEDTAVFHAELANISAKMIGVVGPFMLVFFLLIVISPAKKATYLELERNKLKALKNAEEERLAARTKGEVGADCLKELHENWIKTKESDRYIFNFLDKLSDEELNSIIKFQKENVNSLIDMRLSKFLEWFKDNRA